MKIICVPGSPRAKGNSAALADCFGKRLVCITTQGQPDEKRFDDIFPRYTRFFKWYGFEKLSLIRVCRADWHDRVLKSEEVVQLVDETVRDIFPDLIRP